MRVVSGKVRGLQLKTIESDATRPTKDMVKEALFSILMSKTPDSVFLDLFAGSGAIGIEALSRGAEKAYFSDNNIECIKVITDNLKKARMLEDAYIFHGDYLKMIDEIKEIKFDIIFIDPPYSKGLGIKAIERISSYNLLKIDGILVYETDEVENIPDTIGMYERFNDKKYGRNVLNFYKRKE